MRKWGKGYTEFNSKMPLNSLVSPLATTTITSPGQTREKLPQRKNGVTKAQTPSTLTAMTTLRFLFFFPIGVDKGHLSRVSCCGLKNIFIHDVFKCLRFRKFMTLD